MVHQASVNGGVACRQERVKNTERHSMRWRGRGQRAKGVRRPKGNGIHAGCAKDESEPGAEPLGQRQERLSVDVIALQARPCPCAAAMPPLEPPLQCLAADGSAYQRTVSRNCTPCSGALSFAALRRVPSRLIASVGASDQRAPARQVRFPASANPSPA